jgi:hypothetical protein
MPDVSGARAEDIDIMKKRIYIVLSLIMIMLSRPGMAQVQNPFIGIFADSSRQYDAYCSFDGEKAIVEMWVYCYPSIRGLTGVEFSIDYPTNVMQSTIIANDEIISIQTGDLSSGINILYHECQRGIHWCYHQFLFVNTHELTRVDVLPIRARNCEPDYANESLYKWADVYLNYFEGCGVGGRDCRPPLEVITSTEVSSWGAIKALYDY